MRNFDFSSWHSVLYTLIGLALFALIGIGIRLLMMVTIQQRRKRMNRQINERLKTLIAAYKVLGGSFTGDLTVNPAHLGDSRRARNEDSTIIVETGSDRARRIRDAVEAALSDVILLGTEEQVRFAQRATRDLVTGKTVRTDELVISLRNFIRKALDLEPVPADLQIPPQGPARPFGSGGRGRGDQGAGRGGGAGAGGIAAGGAGMGLGAGTGTGGPDDNLQT